MNLSLDQLDEIWQLPFVEYVSAFDIPRNSCRVRITENDEYGNINVRMRRTGKTFDIAAALLTPKRPGLKEIDVRESFYEMPGDEVSFVSILAQFLLEHEI